jgi:LCP family protein required for cell wall assembly
MQVQTRRRPASLDPTDIPFSPAPYAGGGRSGRDGGTKTRKRRRPDPLWARLTVILGALLMMASGAAIVGSKALIGQLTSGITQDNLLGDAVKSDAEGGASLDGPIDLLLLGLDLREGWDKNATRADTIIILHVPATHDQAYLVSIPRDSVVDIPRFEKSGYGGGRDRINAAFFHGAQNGGGWAGGAQLMAQTIKRTTGISFDGAAIIDFNGFKGVIEALGTIPMCVDHEVKSIHYLYVDGKLTYIADAKKMSGHKEPVTYKVGCREMKGWEALDYSRQRKGLPNGDYDRQRHQQQLIKAMAKKAMSTGVVTNLPKLRELINAAGKAFTLDTGGVPIDDFIFTLKGVAANDLVLLRTNNGTFASAGGGGERLTAESLEMFRAVKSDSLAQYVADHPTVLANEK